MSRTAEPLAPAVVSHALARIARLRSSPLRAGMLTAAALLILVLISLVLRTRAWGTGYWMDEGLSVGIASHHFSTIPHLLRQDGSPPLFYLLLHVWIQLFGTSERATHALSLLFALACIPVGFWSADRLFSRRAAWCAALLFTVNPFLTRYAQETRMYSLLVLLALVAATAFAEVYVRRSRRWLPVLAIALALLCYTHNWGLFFAVGAGAVALVIAWRAADRRALLIDVAIGFGAAVVLYAPWLPTLLFQGAHTGAPWTNAPRFGAPIIVSRDVLGGGGATVALVIAGGWGAWQLRARDRARWGLLWTLLGIVIATLLVGWLISQVSPAWNPRYLAVIVGALVVCAAVGLAEARAIGLVALLIVLGFWVNPHALKLNDKTDAKQIAEQLHPQLAAGDLVVVTSPEQVPLMRYYFGPRLRYASTLGATGDTQVMDWIDALDRLRAARVEQQLLPLVAALRPGQHLLLIRPVTPFNDNWNAPWTRLVRRRSAQWGGALAADPALQLVGTGPRFYPEEPTDIGVHAVLYVKR